MIFQEHKTKTEDGEIHYLCEDVFGIIEIYSKEKLDAEKLDLIVVHILKINNPQGEIKINYGKQQQGELTVRYTFEAINEWGEDPSDQ